MLNFGVMQGRLTDKGGFFPQKFPWDNWQEEFFLARDMGFDSLEWMFNNERWEENPIVTEASLPDVQKCIRATGVSVSGICANYFMNHCIYDSNADAKKKNGYILGMLAKNADKIGCANIILPMFGESGGLFEKEIFWKEMCLLCNEIEWGDVRILIETDAPMHTVGNFLMQDTVVWIGICYDMGNAAGLGKDVLYEMQTYSALIGEYHIKDKKRGKSTVMLGEGDVPYQECVDWLMEHESEAPLILESYYGEHAVEDTKKNLQFVKDQMKK